MAAVGKHGAAQVGSGRGAHYFTPKSLFYEIGDVARVINMGMRQNHGVDVLGGKGKMTVTGPGILTFALIKTAVQENFIAIKGDKMLRSGNGLSCPAKGYFHRITFKLLLEIFI